MGFGPNFLRVVADEQKHELVIDGKFADDDRADREVVATWVYAREMDTGGLAPRVAHGVEPRALKPSQTNGGQDWLIRQPWSGKPEVGAWIVVSGLIHVEGGEPENLIWSQTLKVDPPPSDKRVEARGDD